MDVDPEIDELKKLVEQDLALSADTNRTVHKMRRHALWGRVFQLLWLGLILGISVGAFYYLQPYVTNLEGYYTQFQQGTQQAKNLEQQAADFFKKLIPAAPASPQVPTQ